MGELGELKRAYLVGASLNVRRLEGDGVDMSLRIDKCFLGKAPSILNLILRAE